jgi:hypothetical protein
MLARQRILADRVRHPPGQRLGLHGTDFARPVLIGLEFDAMQERRADVPTRTTWPRTAGPFVFGGVHGPKGRRRAGARK